MNDWKVFILNPRFCVKYSFYLVSILRLHIIRAWNDAATNVSETELVSSIVASDIT